MRFLNFVTAAASVGVAAAGVIQAQSVNEETCSNVVDSGEVLYLSVNIIEYPVIVDVELEENAVITIDNTILIDCTNAPTHLHTTVYAIETATVTKTISTATINAGSVAAETGAAASNDKTRTILTEVETKTKTDIAQASNPYVLLFTFKDLIISRALLTSIVSLPPTLTTIIPLLEALPLALASTPT